MFDREGERRNGTEVHDLIEINYVFLFMIAGSKSRFIEFCQFSYPYYFEPKNFSFFNEIVKIPEIEFSLFG